jgi:hypothetical protein
MRKFVTAIGIGALALGMSASAQTSTITTTSATTTTPKRTVNQRRAEQQKRIGEGIENGSLTAGEAKSLEKKESKLGAEEKEMREDDNGKLTAADKAKLKSQENKLSKDIYQHKHDAQHQAKAGGEINERKRNEQRRIGEGVENGSLTAGEAARLERQQQGINKTENGMREADNGKLTAADRKAINQEQNQASKNVYAKKHNARRRK